MRTRGTAGAGRAAGPCFALVALASLYILFSPQPAGPEGPPGADKLVHFLLFALLAGTTRWRFGGSGALLGLVAAYAGLSELVQALFLPHRSGDLRDLLADVVGAAAGWWIARRASDRAGHNGHVGQAGARGR